VTETPTVLHPDSSAVGAIGRVLGAISGSGFELQPALDQIAAEARVLCGADASFCFLLQGDTFRFAAASGGDSAHWAYEQAHPQPIDRRSIVGRVALAGGAVQIPDLAADHEYEAGAYKVGGFRTLLGVPIGPADELVGAFGLGRFDVAPFTEDEIALVSVFADQAAVAIRLARLLAAEHQAQDREQSLGAVLRSIARSEFDVSQVLEAVTAESVRLCGADTGNIAVREGDAYRVKAVAGFSPQYDALERQHRYVADRTSVVGRTLLERAVIEIPDVLDDPDYALLDLQRIGQFRSVIGVPIWQEGEIVGVIANGRREVRPFGEREVGILQAFADQVAIALNVANLLTETREALERESAIGLVLASIARSSFDLHGVLQTVIDSATRLSNADDGNIVRGEAGAFGLSATFTDGIPESFREFISNRRFQAERGSAMGRALMEMGPIQIVDALTDPEYTLLEAQRITGFRTILGIPLIHDDAAIGVLSVWRYDVRAFSEPEINLLSTFADQAAIAISNVRLFETVERQRTELARFAPQVAGLLSSPEGEALLAGHRREISALFCDLRGFTPFAETAEPEELFSVLRQYHATVGEIAVANGGTVEHFAGDGLMIFFNDPTSLPDHPLAAVRTAVAMRDRFAELAAGWRKRGYELGLGIGIGVGYATLGRIGFEGRYDYAGVGVVVTLASRLSTAAAAGEILISQRLHAMVEDAVMAEPVHDLGLKGFTHAVTAYRVTGLRDQARSRG
jgi:GAF domain-containing protein